MFSNLLKPKGDTYKFDAAAAQKRCKIMLVDEDSDTSVPLVDLRAAGYAIVNCGRLDPRVIADCETGVYDVILLDQTAFRIFDQIRNSNPSQYLIALVPAAPDPLKAKYFDKADARLKKPADLAAAKAALDAAIKALFDRNHLLGKMSAALLAAKVDKKVVDQLVEGFKKDIPSTIGGASKVIKEAIKPVKMPVELAIPLWQLVKIRDSWVAPSS